MLHIEGLPIFFSHIHDYLSVGMIHVSASVDCSCPPPSVLMRTIQHAALWLTEHSFSPVTWSPDKTRNSLWNDGGEKKPDDASEIQLKRFLHPRVLLGNTPYISVETFSNVYTMFNYRMPFNNFFPFSSRPRTVDFFSPTWAIYAIAMYCNQIRLFKYEASPERFAAYL